MSDAGADASIATGPRFVAIDVNGQLVRFSLGDLANVEVSAIIGLETGETIAALDVRPLDGELDALGTTSRLYRLDPTSGVAVQVGGQFAPPLSRAAFGLDVNPAFDRVRIVSTAGENIRVNPDTGIVIVDVALSFDAADPNAGAVPRVVGVAYTPAPAGGTTSLYAIDEALDALLLVTNPNGGLLTTVGPLGFDVGLGVGFDIAEDGVAYAAANVGGVSSLYEVDLSTGAMTLIGAIGGEPVHALAVLPP